MGFGVSGLINKYLRPALIRYNSSGTEYFLSGWKDENAIIPDVKKSETHDFQSNITQQAMEDGSIIAEHIIQQPITVSVQFEETNNTLKGWMIENKTTFDKLYDIWKKKTVCQIMTEHKIYENMVVQSMPIQHKAPYRGSLSITCEFTQLNFAKPARSVFVGKDAGLTKSSSPTTNGGSQKLKLT